MRYSLASRWVAKALRIFLRHQGLIWLPTPERAVLRRSQIKVVTFCSGGKTTEPLTEQHPVAGAWGVTGASVVLGMLEIWDKTGDVPIT
jgi:hypothetical protein